MLHDRRPALLALADGTVFRGYSFGAEGEASGEICFNTGMVGYQEVLTDPSYRGQIVTMTYPEIGNYGINSEDAESRRAWAEGFIVREYNDHPSSWRSERSLGDYMREQGVVGISDIDTRKLTAHLRDHGWKMGIISTEDLDADSLVRRAAALPPLEGRDLVQEVIHDRPRRWGPNGYIEEESTDYPRAFTPFGGAGASPVGYMQLDEAWFGFRVVVIDCGVKQNTLRHLVMRRCEVIVAPCTTPAEQILAWEPDGVIVSNGPGDPAALGYVIDEVKKLMRPDLAIFGICLGQQLLGHAFGGTTYKLKFGHRGCNHPVKRLETGEVEITTQNHGYCVDPDSLPDDVEITHINLNDGSLEGMRHKELPIFSVQYHPEAGPGPHDSHYLFDIFIDSMKQLAVAGH